MVGWMDGMVGVCVGDEMRDGGWVVDREREVEGWGMRDGWGDGDS